MNKKILSLTIATIASASIISYVFMIKQNELVSQISRRDYKNSSYLIEGEQITLAGGLSEQVEKAGSASRKITSIFGNEKVGDINNDKKDDIVFVLVVHGSGSGTFYYVVAAVQNKDGSYTGTNGILLGDRIVPQSTELEKGLITINYADRSKSEQMTVPPSIGKSMHFRLTDGNLRGEK